MFTRKLLSFIKWGKMITYNNYEGTVRIYNDIKAGEFENELLTIRDD